MLGLFADCFQFAIDCASISGSLGLRNWITSAFDCTNLISPIALRYLNFEPYENSSGSRPNSSIFVNIDLKPEF
jgi:hypothetical protein